MYMLRSVRQVEAPVGWQTLFRRDRQEAALEDKNAFSDCIVLIIVLLKDVLNRPVEPKHCIAVEMIELVRGDR